MNDAGDVNRGILGIGGNVTGVNDLSIDNADAVRILSDTTLSLTDLDLSTAGSVIGSADIAIVPSTLGSNINVGNAGDRLLNGANIAAFIGFPGGLDIGGSVDPTGVVPGVAPGLAGDVTVEQPIFLGPGSTLTIAALGDILLEAIVFAEQINLIAVGDDGSALGGPPAGIGACGGCIEDIGDFDVVVADRAVLVANTTIGTTANKLNVDIFSTLDFASGQDDITDTIDDQFFTFSGTNLGVESSAIVAAYQLAFNNLVLQGNLSALFTAPGIGTGLEVRDESLFSSGTSAFGTDFLIFDPGEGAKTRFDQDEELPSAEELPINVDDDNAWIEFFRTKVLRFVKGRWLSDENLVAYVLETYDFDISPEGDATFEQMVALRDQVSTKSDRTAADAELLRILEAFVAEYPVVVAYFKTVQTRMQTELATQGSDTFDLPGNLPDDTVPLPSLPALPAEPSASLDGRSGGFANLRVVGQTWREGGMGIEDSWTGRSAFPLEFSVFFDKGVS